jgi:hypothetical protein
MNLEELLNVSDVFQPKSGSFITLDQLTTEDLIPFRGVHEFETCLEQVQSGSTYQNHFYFWQDMRLSCQAHRQQRILFIELMPPSDRVKKWPAPVCLLQLEIIEFKTLTSTEAKMNYVISLNHQLLMMANAIANADTRWVCWSDGKIGRNPKSPGAMLSAMRSDKPKPKKSWWNF